MKRIFCILAPAVLLCGCGSNNDSKTMEQLAQQNREMAAAISNLQSQLLSLRENQTNMQYEFTTNLNAGIAFCESHFSEIQTQQEVDFQGEFASKVTLDAVTYQVKLMNDRLANLEKEQFNRAISQ